MLESLVHFLQENIIPLGALGVFLASVIEEIIAPIPSAFVLLTAGFLFLPSLSGVSFLTTLVFKIVLVSAIGLTLGSLFIYGLAYHLGKPFLDKVGKYIGLSWDDVEKGKERFSRGPRDELTLFICRAIPLIPSVAIASLAGLIRMRPSTYITFSFLGSLVRSTVLALLGAQVGRFYFAYVDKIDKYEDYVLFSMIIGVLAFLIYRLIKSKRGRVTI